MKKGASPQQQIYIDYAYQISQSEDFVFTLEAENGLWSHDRVSILPGANGYRDYGFCQISLYYHPKIVKDPRFNDPYWQLDQCWKLFKGGTKFYGKANIPKAKQNFIVTK